MKTLTQQEIARLVKEKKLPPSVLKPYQETEDKKESSKEDKLIEAIYLLVAAIAKSDNSKAILEAIKEQPEIVVKNIIPIEKKELNEAWEMVFKRDNRMLIMSPIVIQPIKI